MIPTVTERKQMIEKIRSLPQVLDDAVAGLSDQQLDTPYGPGKWTLRQVVHHLADSHANALIRMKLALTEDRPTIKPYDQEKWAETADAKSLPIQPSLSMVAGIQARMTAFWESLPDPAYSRPYHHPETGDHVLADLLRIYSNHGAQHVQSIVNLRNAKGW